MSDFKIEEVINIIQDAGGKIVGRTRLQKIAYLLTATGLDGNFSFSYKHYGPFSETLASSAEIGALVGKLNEVQKQTSWGGTYSIYTADENAQEKDHSARSMLASIASDSNSIELELAATAVFLAYEGYEDAWEETAQRKPEKASPEHLENAKTLLKKLATVSVPRPLPTTLLN
ncbi:hypothetical protein FF124_08385 [Martelella lutilitoris]|uniref:DUF4065 domain-containing protein n=1 Tax=Martelella lutilitoris TaxID=2583532 RepID=A0A5C4JSX3_9HYPH|nr:hypothetical protein [Martelella lutilitoris]TNB48340.1 hypothetical protein FF124_08385 [Martelella lutilitoris]